MPSPTYYTDATGLQNALGPVTYLAIFDDVNAGSVSTGTGTPVDQVLSRAHAQVVSRLVSVYGADGIPSVLPSSIPALLVDAELNYAVALAWQRHPEYVRAVGAKNATAAAYERADMTMKNVADAIQRLPEVVATPSNVGGVVTDGSNRLIIDSSDGTSNAGDF